MQSAGSSPCLRDLSAWAEPLVRAAGKSGVGIAVSNASSDTSELHWLYASDYALELISLTPKEFVGSRVIPSHFGHIPFVSSSDRRPSSGNIVYIASGNLVRSDATEVPIDWITIESEPQLFVHWLIRTDRYRFVSTKLSGSFGNFRQLVKRAPDGIIVLVERRVVYANHTAAKLCGLDSTRRLEGATLERFVSLNDLAVANAAVEAVFCGERLNSPLELRFMHESGQNIPVETLLVRGNWGVKPAVVIVARDVSGRRQVQSQSIKMDRLSAVGTLAAGVAHEINNPLAYVLLNLQYLIRELPKLEASGDRVGHLLERLREARHGAERVSSIVRDLRTFSRTDEEEAGAVELRRVLLSAIKVARSQLMDRGQIIEILDEVPMVRGNASRLEQVFLNLLINAIQALNATKPEENVVRIRVTRSDEAWVLVEISDTGIGIASELLDRVFDPFFTTKPVGLGTGLGLPICHSIITKMGGTIGVSSQVGRGTTFHVRLPADRGARLPAIRTPTPPPLRVTKQARILVVDDELTVVSMLSRILSEEHTIEAATSAETALELLDREDFDVVLCDLLMPNMSGVDLYEEVSRRYPGLQERIVFMTGGAFTPRAAQFLSKVSNPRIEKPFNMKSLRRLMREMAARRHGATR
jgi:PAS domain S-box-containing protein